MEHYLSDRNSTYHVLYYTSRGALLGQEITQGVHHEGSTQQHIALKVNGLTTELHLAPNTKRYINVAETTFVIWVKGKVGLPKFYSQFTRSMQKSILQICEQVAWALHFCMSFISIFYL